MALAWSVGFAEVEEIDSINIYWAGQLAMRRAVEGLLQKPAHVLVDGRRVKDLAIPQQAIVRGDCKSLSIAAASILAKTARDAVMRGLDARFPGYGLAQHKGYPVNEHLVALEKLGASPIHRRSFAPVRLVMGLPPLAPWPRPNGAVGSRPPARTRGLQKPNADRPSRRLLGRRGKAGDDEAVFDAHIALAAPPLAHHSVVLFCWEHRLEIVER